MTTQTPDAIALRRGALEDASAETVLVSATRARVEALSVADPQGFEAASSLVKLIKQRAAYLDNARKARVGPLTDVVRLLNADYRPAIAAYEAFEATLKQRMGAYVQAQQQARVTAMLAAHAVPIPAVETVTGIAVRAKRKWRVTDADKVPRQFCCPDPTKIQAHLDNGGLEAIAGIEFYEEAQVIVHKDR
jgi:hypothetical protein